MMGQQPEAQFHVEYVLASHCNIWIIDQTHGLKDTMCSPPAMKQMIATPVASQK